MIDKYIMKNAYCLHLILKGISNYFYRLPTDEQMIAKYLSAAVTQAEHRMIDKMEQDVITLLNLSLLNKKVH